MATTSDKPLKIGLVIDTSLDTTEGVPQYVLTIGQWLAAQGHEVHYLAGETHRQDLLNLHSLARNMKVRFNGTVTTIPRPTSRRKLQAFVRQEQFDILHVQTPHHPLMAQRIILAADPSTAVLATFHILPYGRVARWGTRLLGWWLRPSLRRVDTMLAVSPAAAEYEQWAFHRSAQIAPNAFDYPLFHHAQPLDKYDDQRLTILYLGRLVPRKGCMLLLQAIAQLKQSSGQALPDFRVVVCSKGPLEAQLRAYVAEQQLTDQVEFAGFVSEIDKPRYYASADISVFPSSSGESFGIVLIEAMASGRAAVLGGDNPGYHSVLGARPQQLFDPHDAMALAELLKKYLQDQALRQGAAAWGATESQRYDVDRVGNELVKHYRQALRKRANP